MCAEGSRSSHCNGEAARPERRVATIPNVTSGARRGRFTGLRLAGSGPDAPLEQGRGGDRGMRGRETDELRDLRPYAILTAELMNGVLPQRTQEDEERACH